MPNYTVQCPKCDAIRTVFRNLSEHGQWPKCCAEMMVQVLQPPQVMQDIRPYQAMGTDIATGTAPIIGSRREHREYLRRNGYFEVGTEKPHPPKRQVDTVTGHDIKRAIEQVRGK